MTALSEDKPVTQRLIDAELMPQDARKLFESVEAAAGAARRNASKVRP